MPKPTKKQYVVTYFRIQDEKRSEKSGKQIPLRTALVDAFTPEDAIELAQTGARAIISAVERGRGALKKNPGFYTVPEKPVAEDQLESLQTDGDGSLVVAKLHELLDSDAVQVDGETDLSPSTEVWTVDEAEEVPAPIFDEIEEVTNVPVDEEAPTAELTVDDRAEFDRLGKEAAKAHALAVIDRLIEANTYAIESDEKQLDALDQAEEASLERWTELETIVHNVENRRSLRPIALDALRAYHGSIPVAIPEEDATLAQDINDLTYEVVAHRDDNEQRWSLNDFLEHDLDVLEVETRALKFLRSEITGEPFVEDEPEDDEFDEEQQVQVPFATPATVDDDDDEDGNGEKTVNIFTALVVIVGAGVTAVFMRQNTVDLVGLMGIVALGAAGLGVALAKSKPTNRKAVD